MRPEKRRFWENRALQRAGLVLGSLAVLGVTTFTGYKLGGNIGAYFDGRSGIGEQIGEAAGFVIGFLAPIAVLGITADILAHLERRRIRR